MTEPNETKSKEESLLREVLSMFYTNCDDELEWGYTEGTSIAYLKGKNFEDALKAYIETEKS